MKKPYYSRIKGKKIGIDNRILADLQMTLGSVLYAVELRNRNQSEWILSPIPPSIWDEAYELVVMLAKDTGTLGGAAGVLADLKISVFASTVSPVSADGEVCWTAVAQIPKGESQEEISRSLAEKLKALLPCRGEAEEGDFIRLTPMTLLRAFGKMKQARFFSGKVEDSCLYLDKFADENGGHMLTHLQRYFMRSQRTGIPPFCLLSVDSEEKYLRMTFPPMRADLYELSMDVQILSEQSENFHGVFAAVTQALGAAEANIYASDNYMLEKKHSKGWTEEARFSFTVDLSNAEEFSLVSMKITEDNLYGKIEAALAKVAEERRIVLPRNKFTIKRKDAHKPRCFFATNATNKDRKYHGLVKRAIDLFSRLGLEAVNVDITKLPTVREDATNVLRSCGFLVSLHLPSQSMKADSAAIDIELGEFGKEFMPSDWLMFEEAFMLAQGRRVFRLRHQDVRRPRYGVGEFDYPFDDTSSFETRLERLEALLAEYMTSPDYQKSLQDCVAFVEQLDIINVDRDLYRAYQLEAGVDAGDILPTGPESVASGH